MSGRRSGAVALMVFAGLVGCTTTPEQPAKEKAEPAIPSSRFEDPFFQPIPGLVALAEPDGRLVTVKAKNHTLAEVVHALNRAVPAAWIELDGSLESGRRLTLNAKTVPWREALKDIANAVDAEIHQDLNGRPVLAGPSQLLVELNDEPVIVGLRTIAKYARRRLVVLGELSTSCRFRRVGDWRVILTDLLTQEGLHARVCGDALIVSDRPVMLGAAFTPAVGRFGAAAVFQSAPSSFVAAGVKARVWFTALAGMIEQPVVIDRAVGERRVFAGMTGESPRDAIAFTAAQLGVEAVEKDGILRIRAPRGQARRRVFKAVKATPPVLIQHGGASLPLRFEAALIPSELQRRYQEIEPLAIVSGRAVRAGDVLIDEDDELTPFKVASFDEGELAVSVEGPDGKRRILRRIKLGETGPDPARMREQR